MRKKRTTQRPRRERVTSIGITPAAWNLLRSVAFQPQTGQPLPFAECLALEARANHFDRDTQLLIVLVVAAWRQSYPDAPVELSL